MSNYLYILLILFNLNFLLLAYSEVMVKIITMFNYKNTTSILNTFFFTDIIIYTFYKNKTLPKIILAI